MKYAKIDDKHDDLPSKVNKIFSIMELYYIEMKKNYSEQNYLTDNLMKYLVEFLINQNTTFKDNKNIFSFFCKTMDPIEFSKKFIKNFAENTLNLFEKSFFNIIEKNIQKINYYNKNFKEFLNIISNSFGNGEEDIFESLKFSAKYFSKNLSIVLGCLPKKLNFEKKILIDFTITLKSMQTLFLKTCAFLSLINENFEKELISIIALKEGDDNNEDSELIDPILKSLYPIIRMYFYLIYHIAAEKDDNGNSFKEIPFRKQSSHIIPEDKFVAKNKLLNLSGLNEFLKIKEFNFESLIENIIHGMPLIIKNFFKVF